MIRSRPILSILYMCITLSMWAGPVTYHSSNSIGQRLTDLDSKQEVPIGYYLTIEETPTETVKTLYFEDSLEWEEYHTIDGVHAYMDRIDASGKTLLKTHHINNQLVSLQQLIDGDYQSETYLYDMRGQLYSIIRTSDDSVKDSLFFVNDEGRLEGLIVYQEIPDADRVLDHSLIFSTEQDTFAIGNNDVFKINLIKDGVHSTLTYRSGTLQNEKIQEITDEKVIEIIIDHGTDTILETISDPETGRLLEETFNSPTAPSDDYHMINSYDENGVLFEKQVENQEGIMNYSYYLNSDEQRSVRVLNNGILHKEVTYTEDLREEKVYLEGEYYATVVYSEDNEIVEVRYE